MLWFMVGIGLLVFVLAPVRRAWRFTVPLVVSLGVGFVVGAFLVRFGLPAYTLPLALVAAVLVVAPALREWLGENLGLRNGRGGGEGGNGSR